MLNSLENNENKYKMKDTKKLDIIPINYLLLTC
jgi:hypothetical protein